MKIFVTVGMGRWPFDRLVEAIEPLSTTHSVIAQIGPSRVRPPCPHTDFMPYDEFIAAIHSTDVVITHAGNTVRLVQRAGRVPVAVARERARKEMGNDHQVEFLREEQRLGRVVAVWDTGDLPNVVDRHPEAQSRMLRERPLPPAASTDRLIETMDALCRRLKRG